MWIYYIEFGLGQSLRSYFLYNLLLGGCIDYIEKGRERGYRGAGSPKKEYILERNVVIDICFQEMYK